MLQIDIQHLEPSRLAQGYPLVRSAVGISASLWCAYALDLIGAGGGVIGAQVDEACLYGIAAYRPLRSNAGDRVLDVELLAAVELAGFPSVRTALEGEIAAIGKRSGCARIVSAWAPTGDVRQSASRADGPRRGTVFYNG